MELDHFLHKVQGVLQNEQRLIGSLNTLNKDNEEIISKVVNSLEKVIADEEFASKIQQKLYILLFLNTDTQFYNEFKKNRKCTHLVGFFPKLSCDLFIKIVMGLNLHQCLYESVLHFSPSLSYQVLDICINALNRLDLFETVNFVEDLLTFLFKKIIAMDENDKYNLLLKDTFQRLLLHYNAEKGGTIKRMSRWKSSQLKHYGGLVMGSLLSLLEKCTRMYCKLDDDSTGNDYSLYDIQTNLDLVKITPMFIGHENRLITVTQCYEHVVAKCLENISSITIALWLFWVDIDLDDIPDTENTLQRQIGEKAYTCREMLKKAEGLGVSSKDSNDLISKLQNLALKPNTEEDQSISLDLGQIIMNIKDPTKNTAQWLGYLLNNPSFDMEPAALEVYKKHVNLLPSTNVLKLYNLLFNFIKTNQNCAAHKSFVLEVLKSLDIYTQMEVAVCFVNVCGVAEILKTEDFQPLFVETFNKVINEEDKEKELYPQFLCLALQSAKSVVFRAVAEGITSEVRGHLMADVLGRLQVFCDAGLTDNTPLLITALDDLLITLPEFPENQQANYPLFVRELVMRKSLAGERFIKDCLMKKLHLNLKTKNWAVLTASLETLSELYDVDCVHNCPASLVMLLQVVQANRWGPTTFSMATVRVCELALQLVAQFVSKCIDISIDEQQLNNLKALVQQSISPLNRYHLNRLLDEPIPSDPAMHLMYRMHYGIGEWSILQISDNERLQLVYALCYVLPVLTPNEWQELFCVTAPKCSEFLSLFHIVTDSLMICLDSAKISSDPVVMSCLNFSIINVAQVVKYELNRWTKNDNEYRISVLSKMCQMVSSLPASNQETFGLTLIKVLQQLLPESSRRKPLTAHETNSVTASIASIQAPSVRQNLSREFLEMIHR